jgi:hypothetical protein
MAWRLHDVSVSRMRMNERAVSVAFSQDIVWIGLETVSCTPLGVPGWAREIFASRPWRAAVAEGREGYLILEWPAGYSLESLPVPGSSLRSLTRRALIVTCADESASDPDIRLRYFAPQHGVAEDVATGSAMRVLAAYWRSRGMDDELLAQQCSPEGGVLRSRIDPYLTWVGGRVITDEGAAVGGE